MSIFDEIEGYKSPAPPGVKLPIIKIPKRYYNELNLPNNSSNFEFLKAKCFKEANNLGLNKLDDYNIYKERIDYELNIFEELGFTDYILLNWYILNFCHEKDILVGKGRGSAPSSLLLYLLKVTRIDPIKYELFFERFVSKSRARKFEVDGESYLDGSLLADVDSDIAYHKRQDVINFIREEFKGKTCNIANFNCLKSKICIKECGKIVAEYSEEDMNLISDLIPKEFSQPKPLIKSREESEKFNEWCEANPNVYEVAKKIEGLIKNVSVHASGLAISYYELDDIMPMQRTKDGEIISCYDMNWVAELTVKFDILGLKTLTIVDEVCKANGLNYYEIDDDNSEDYKWYSNYKYPYGLFQISADTNFKVCKECMPRNLEHMAAIVALARPGALAYVGDYSEFLASGKPQSVHPFFDDILNKTGGLPLFQEQTMKMVVKIGFSADEAEILRRIVGKKKVSEMPAWEQKIKDKIKENGLDPKIGDVLWKVLKDSANYSFNFSHSVSYASLAVITTILKVNYTSDFFTSCLNMSKNEQDPFDHINRIVMELQKFGINLMRPDLKLSDMGFKREGGNIRYGLQSIKTISDKSLDNLQNFVKYRDDSEGTKFDIFLCAKQAKINIGNLCALIQAGMLTSLGSNRPRTVLEAQVFNLLTDREKRNIIELGSKYNHDVLEILSKEVLELKSTGDDGKPIMKEDKVSKFLDKYKKYKEIYLMNQKYPMFASWYFEHYYLGYSYSYSLRSVFLNKENNLMNCEEALEAEPDEEVKVVGIVNSIIKRKSKEKENIYYRINLVDETASLNTMFFEHYFNKYLEKKKELPKKKDIIIITGIKKDGGVIFVNDINPIEDKIYIKLSEVK